MHQVQAVKLGLKAIHGDGKGEMLCSLRWAWEIKIPDLAISVFVIQSERSKGVVRLAMLKREQVEGTRNANPPKVPQAARSTTENGSEA